MDKNLSNFFAERGFRSKSAGGDKSPQIAISVSEDLPSHGKSIKNNEFLANVH